MSVTREQQVQEIERNYEVFRKMKFPPRLSRKYAVMRDEKIVKYADTSYEAELWGMRKYKDNRFSIQQIDAKPLYMSGFQYAIS